MNATVVLVLVWQDLFTVKLQERRPFDGWHELHQLPNLTLLLLSMFVRVWPSCVKHTPPHLLSLETQEQHMFQFGF